MLLNALGPIRFPSVLLQPLGHLSVLRIIRFTGVTKPTRLLIVIHARIWPSHAGRQDCRRRRPQRDGVPGTASPFGATGETLGARLS